MRTRSFVAAGVATATALTGLVVASEQASAGSGRDLHFYAEYIDIQTLDLGAPGVGIGDALVYTDRVWDSAKKTKKLGTGFGNCVRLTGKTDFVGIYNCTETVRLKGGDVLIGGLYDLAAKSDVWTIAGGTGRYRGSTGEIYFRPLDAATLDGVIRFDD